MKNLTMKMMFAAATLVAAAGVASAQTLEANVPFAFRANGQVFAPGTYRIQMQRSLSGNPLIAIRGTDPHKQVLTSSYPDGPAKAAWQNREGGAFVRMRREPLPVDEALDGLGRPDAARSRSQPRQG